MVLQTRIRMGPEKVLFLLLQISCINRVLLFGYEEITDLNLQEYFCKKTSDLVRKQTFGQE